LLAKAIMHFLVNTVTRGLQQHLIRDLYREEHFDQLVREREDVAARRQECTAGLAALREALTALERLPANLMSRVRPGWSSACVAFDLCSAELGTFVFLLHWRVPQMNVVLAASEQPACIVSNAC
jgi:hypothetical protein